jgi:hypothetical protein
VTFDYRLGKKASIPSGMRETLEALARRDRKELDALDKKRKAGLKTKIDLEEYDDSMEGEHLWR